MMGSVLAICAPAQAVRCIVASPQALCDADATGKQMDKSKELAKMVFGGLGIKKWAGQKTVSTLHHVHPND